VLTFANSRTVPPGGLYFYDIPEFGMYMESLSWRDLLAKVRGQYGANQVPPPVNLELMIQDYMCRKLPKGFCIGETPEGAKHPLTFWDIKDRTTSMLLRGRRALVPLLQAKSRAEVCANCKQNDRSMCPTCIGLNAWARLQTKQSVPGSELWLGVCEVDGVSLVARVNMLDAGTRTAEHPEGCWLS
jgi:hypothetical protein